MKKKDTNELRLVHEEWEYHPIYGCYSRLVYVMLYGPKNDLIRCVETKREYKELTV